jgi:Leucine-rich repeat (LRR) protein
VFIILAQIGCLRDLKLAKNKLEGPLNALVGGLKSLEFLDLHENLITTLPDSLQGLIELKTLNVADNNISSLDFGVLSQLHITELTASKNKLSGVLIPANVESMPYLRLLSVSTNSVTSITESSSTQFPCLQSLMVSNNRLQSLPDMSSMPNLSTIAAEDNRISEFPTGFASLENVRNVDLAGNDFKSLETFLADMESLAVLNVQRNPLRERNFAELSTEEVKRILRGRKVPEELPPPEDFALALHDDYAGESDCEITCGNNDRPPTSLLVSSAWQIKSGGILDLSGDKIEELPIANCEHVASKHEIKVALLHHNSFSQIPQNLIAFSATLTVLDLSTNNLFGSQYIDAPLSLPQLKELNISSNAFTSLDPLVQHLSASMLEILDISFNRVVSIPALRECFPNLTHLQASNNSVNSLSPPDLEGLKFLDLSSNDIGHLPPKLGLLRSIQQLDVKGNRFRVPKHTVLDKGTDTVMRWLRDKIPAGERGDEDDNGVD